MPSISRHIILHASEPERIWPLLRDGRSLAALAEHVVSVTPAPGGQPVTRWSVSLNGSVVSWTQREHQRSTRALSFEQVDGDFQALRGEWYLEPAGAGVRVSLAMEFDLGVDGLAPLLEPIWSQSLLSHADALLASIRRALEVTHLTHLDDAPIHT